MPRALLGLQLCQDPVSTKGAAAYTWRGWQENLDGLVRRRHGSEAWHERGKEATAHAGGRPAREGKICLGTLRDFCHKPLKNSLSGTTKIIWSFAERHYGS